MKRLTLVVVSYPFEITPADIAAMRQALETYLGRRRGAAMPGWPASLWPLVPEQVGEVVTSLEGTLVFPPWTLTPSPNAPLELSMTVVAAATAAFASSRALSATMRNGPFPASPLRKPGAGSEA